MTDPARPRLAADCGNCFALCCVAPGFATSADFPISKAPGMPCRHLSARHDCSIHDELRPRGFRGCTVFDCFGAGQQVSQVTFAGRDWRTHPGDAAPMFDAFAVMRTLHESLHHLAEARSLLAAPPAADRPSADIAARAGLLAEVDATTAATVALTGADADTLLAADLPAHRRTVHDLLTRASALLRTGRVDAAGRPTARARGRGLAGRPRDLGSGNPRNLGIDLVGARLAGVDLRGAQLTGRLLIEADLRGADLRGADLRGADLRGAEVSGADLRGALFVVQAQLDAARGDEATTLPAALTRPAHWTAPPTRPAAAQSEATVEHGRRRG
ncbi:pentapeptide repeat-containing protein [Frankia tisae]|uniref:pentapeptide repeat-containing protein n=1 Tax=Frankia tisae TaxID=2950104 RepID=UPI003F686FEA